MFIESLTVSEQHSRRTVCESIAEPDWPQIRRALERLPSQERGWLTLDGKTSQLSVGTHSDGFTLCAYDTQQDRCLYAQPSRLESVLQAVRAYALGGRLTHELAWQTSVG